MNDNSSANGSRSRDPYARFRLIALIAAIVGVIVLAAAAFVLSYGGIHQIALAAGVSARLARLFPVILDAMLVVACAAVLSLRGAGWWRRGYSWLITLALLVVMAVADAVHATGTHLPRRPIAATVAVVPWVLLLLAFSLLLSMLRQFRHTRAALASPPATPEAAHQPAVRVATAAEARAHPAPAPGVTVTRPISAEQARPVLDSLLARESAPPLTVRGETGPLPPVQPAAPAPGPAQRAVPQAPAEATQPVTAVPPRTITRPGAAIASETAASTAASNGTATPAVPPDHAAATEKQPPGQQSGDKSPEAGPVADDQPTPPASTSKSPAAEQPAAEPSASEPPVSEQPSSDQSAADHATADHSTSEHPTAEQPSAEQPSAEQPSAEQPSGDQPTSEPSAAEQPASAQPTDAESPAQPQTTKHPMADQSGEDGAPADQPSEDKAPGEQPSENHAPAEQASEDQSASGEDPPASSGSGGIHVPHQPRRAPVPAPSPHFDRLRSTPTPPEEDPEPDS